MRTRHLRLSGERLASRIALSADVAFGDWHNESNPLDVDGSGYVTPIDALHVINTLNAFTGGSVEEVQQRWFDQDAEADELLGGFFPDGDENGSITPLDALRVINRLSDQTSGSTVAIMPDQQGRPRSAVYTAADARTKTVDVSEQDLSIVWSGNEVMLLRADGIPSVIAKPGVGILNASSVIRGGLTDVQATVTRFGDDGSLTTETYVCMPIMGGPDFLSLPTDPRRPIDGFEETSGAMVSRTVMHADGISITEEYLEGALPRLLSVSATLPTGDSASVDFQNALPRSMETAVEDAEADLRFVLQSNAAFNGVTWTATQLIEAVEELGGIPQTEVVPLTTIVFGLDPVNVVNN